MLRKIGNIIVWLMLGAWFLLISGTISEKADDILCNRIEVVMQDTLNNLFVTPAQVRELVLSAGQQIQGYPMEQINTRVLEKRLEKNPYIRNAEVCTDISGRLEVRIEQREALLRLMPGGSEGYYLDTRGKVLPLSSQFTPLILLVTGKLPSGKGVEASFDELFRFGSYLSQSEFWKDQVVQVYVDANQEYELIPRVGAHQILLGSLDNWERKLRNLELLYDQGLSVHGWNNYRTINLKYTNQVICTKR